MIELRRARLAHSLPGRVRLRLDPRELSEENCGEILGALTSLPGVEDVRITPRTGSVVIRFDPAALDVDRLGWLAREAEILALEPGAAAAADRPPSLTAQRVMRTFGEVDARLAELTEGRWDLRSVVPFAFGALALRQAIGDFGALGAAPWYVFAWYAFDSFWKLNEQRRRSDAPPSEPGPVLPEQE